MAQFSRSIAIVVGINQYQHGIPPLNTAVADATAISQVLKSNHGYYNILLTDSQAIQVVLRSPFSMKSCPRSSQIKTACFRQLRQKIGDRNSDSERRHHETVHKYHENF
jgi:hypothetical protein